MKNIGFHEVVDRATMKRNKTQAAPDLAETALNYTFEVFKNRGLILNTQGFKGDIKVANCEIEQNMVYIQEIMIEPAPIVFEYYDVDDEDAASEFADDDVILKFKVCLADGSYGSKYYLNDVIDPNTEFDDAKLVDQME